MRPAFRTLTGLLLCGCSASAWSAEVETAPAMAAAVEAAPGDEIVVTGQRMEYGVKSTSTATRTNAPLKDVPQAITVISEAQIEDQALRSVADVLTFVPGAMPGTGEGNRDQVTLRGNNTTADFFVDGIRDDVQYSRDLYNVDRVEILKGPNAMIFGRGGGGGVINRVTKRASLADHREFAVQGDSEGGYRLTADVDSSLGGTVGLRINGMYEDGESFRRHVDLQRYAINPTVGILAGPDTRIDLSYEYLNDHRTTDRGVPSDGDRPLEGYNKVFFGDPDDSFADSRVHLATLAVTHDFGSGLTLRNRTLAGDYDKYYRNVFPSNLDEATRQVTLGAYNSRNDRRNLFNQTDLIWNTRLGGIDHTLLLGFEFGRQTSRNLRQSGTFAPFANGTPGNRVSLDDVTYDADVRFAPSSTDADNRTRATVAAVYVQDQIRFSPMFEVLAGVRFDRFALKVNDLRVSNDDYSRTDELVSPRLGFIFKPQPSLSIYAGYSRSYLPQSGEQFSGLTSTTDVLKPERFDNYEVGAKWEVLEGLLATAAIYKLDRTNTQARDAEDRIVQTGATRTRGIELGLERSVSARWQISGGYAWQKSEITEATTAAPAGREVPLVPRHQFSLWNRYDVTDQLGLGLGVVARSKAFAAISNTVTLPGYARVDAAAFYRVAPNVRAQVNVENLLGADYFSTAHSDNNIAPGAPRTIRATLRFGI